MTNIIPRKNLNIKNRIMAGGRFPEDIIKKIKLTDETITSYLIESTDRTFNFQFTEKNENILDTFKYLGKGGLTSVYSIKLTHQYSLSQDKYTIPDIYHDKLILRIYKNINYSGSLKSEVNVGNEDLNDDYQSSFIKKWTRDKTTYPENIIDIFMYGEISLLGDYLGYYTITREYNNDDFILSMSLENKLKFLMSFIEFLQKLKENNFVYRDCKIENIGVEIKGDQCIFIILDYDDVTLFTEDEFNKFKTTYGIYYHFGTFPPLYILPFNDDSYNPKLIHLYGIYTLMIELFDKDLETYTSYNTFTNYVQIYMENMIILSLENVQRINKKFSDVRMKETRKVLDDKIQKHLDYFNKNIAKYFNHGVYKNKLIGIIVKLLEPTTQIFFDEADKKYNNIIFSDFSDIINDFLQEVKRLNAPVAPVTPHRHRSVRRSTMFFTPLNLENLEEVVVKQKYLKYKQKYLQLKQKYSQ
jgi:hypothetical protein